MTNIYGYIAGIVILLVVGFGAGWGVNGWRLNSALANEKTAHAGDLKIVSDAATKAVLESQQKQAADLKRIADISDQYQGEINRAKSENDDLLARVNAGTTRLYVAAHCSGNQVSAPGASASGINVRAELDPSARSGYSALRQALEQALAQIKGLQNYAKTVSQTQ